jgi:hypothetical protein
MSALTAATDLWLPESREKNRLDAPNCRSYHPQRAPNQ